MARASGRRLATLARQPLPVITWVLPGWCLLGVARLLITRVPFVRLETSLGDLRLDAAWVPLASEAQARRALVLGRAIRLAAGATPWESACLVQAIVARWLLRLHRVPHAVHLGWPRPVPGRGGAVAHAWVTAGRVRVTGGDGFQDHQVLGTFVARELLA